MCFPKKYWPAEVIKKSNIIDLGNVVSVRNVYLNFYINCGEKMRRQSEKDFCKSKEFSRRK